MTWWHFGHINEKWHFLNYQKEKGWWVGGEGGNKEEERPSRVEGGGKIGGFECTQNVEEMLAVSVPVIPAGASGSET